MGSVHIRIDDKLKEKLDGLREGKTTEGKWGYKKKVHYNDLILKWIDEERSYLESQTRYGLIRSLLEFDYGVDSVLKDFIKVLDFFLRTHNENLCNYQVYKELYEILVQFQSKLEDYHF